MNRRELERAIQDLLDGTASEGDARELQALLKAEPDARRTYLEYASLHQSLEYGISRSSPSRTVAPAAAPTRPKRARFVAAALVATGRSSQLPVHLRSSLKAGLTVEELQEVILQTATIAGFPPAMNAWSTLKTIVREGAPDAGS